MIYSMSLISVHGKLAMRFYRDGKAYKTKSLGIPVTTEQLSQPPSSLAKIIADKTSEYATAAYDCQINGSDPYDTLFGVKTEQLSFAQAFAGTNFIEFVGSGASWENIDNATLYEYRDELESNDYADNTIKKYLSDVKIRLDRSAACEIKFPASNYAKILHWKKGTTTSIYLSKAELKAFEDVEINSEEEYAAKTYFLLSAYTGCRFSDVTQLSLSNIKSMDMDNALGEKKFIDVIEYVSQKTCTPTIVPLKPIVKTLLRQGIDGISNNRANQLIPELARRAGITTACKVFKCGKLHEGKKCDFVRTHTARKSFATNVYISRRYDLLSISKMMGHRSLETTKNTYIICGIIEDDGSKSNYFE